jgi:branched-chain amino acid transport system permease protein
MTITKPSAAPRAGGRASAWLRRRPLWAYALAAVILIALPAFLPTYSIGLAQKVLIFALLAISLDLIYGYCGLPSLGQAAYFGVGGYVAGLLLLKTDITSIWLVMPIGIVVGAVFAAVIGLIVLRTKGIVFLLITFAVGQFLASVALEWPLLHSYGVEGLAGVPMPELGGGFIWDSSSTYYAVLIVFAIGYFAALLVTKSPLGYAAQGIREDEPRMRVYGYNTWWVKYKMFILSGALAAMAGQLFAFTTGTVTPTSVDITYSALVFLMVVMGGAGTIYGPVLGAAAITLLEYYISQEVAARWPLILGAIFVLTAVLSRHGLVGLFSDISRFARTRLHTARARWQTQE